MIRINLLPVRAEKRKEILRRHIILGAGIVVVLAAVIVSVHMMIGAEIRDMEARIEQRKAEIARLQAVIGEIKQFRKKKRALEEKIQVIRKLEERQRGPSRMLFEIARLIPDKIWLQSLRDSGGSVALEGYAIDNQTIARFMTRLERSPLFRGVRLEVTRQVSKGGVNLKEFKILTSVAYRAGG